MSKNSKTYLWFAGMLLMIALPVFAHLDEYPFHNWDESRLVANAFEMQRTNNWLVTTFNYTPDLWNTKPPFMIWLIALSFKAFGVNELAARIPSAVLGILTLITIFWFCAKKLQNNRLAFLSCLVLITSKGFCDVHRIRSADFDPLLTFTTTVYCISYFLYLSERKAKYFVFFITGVILATLGKGIAGLMFLPALMFFTLISKQLKETLLDKKVYMGIAAFCIVVLGFYLLREQAAPGYIKAVSENELGGRFLNTIEYHKSPFWFYLDCMYRTDFTWWVMLVLMGVIATFTSGNEYQKKLVLYFLLVAGTFLLIISSAQTKLEWYLMPVYPFIAVVAAMALEAGIAAITRASIERPLKITLNAAIVVMLYWPYSAILEFVMFADFEEQHPYNMNMAYYMSDAMKGRHDIKNVIFTDDMLEHQNVWCYYQMLRKDNNLSFKRLSDLRPNDKVIAFDMKIIKKLDSMYVASTPDSDAVRIYTINGRKL